MRIETSRSERVRVHGERAARVVLPAGLAVVTWLVVLIGVGLVARLDSLSPLNLLPLFVVAIMFWPIYLAAPWKPGLTDRIGDTLGGNRDGVAVAAGLLVVRSLPFTPDVLLTLLDLPFRSAGVLFGAGLFYRRLVSLAFGRFLLSFGQWYLEAFWLFVLGSILAGLGGRVR